MAIKNRSTLPIKQIFQMLVRCHSCHLPSGALIHQSKTFHLLLAILLLNNNEVYSAKSVLMFLCVLCQGGSFSRRVLQRDQVRINKIALGAEPCLRRPFVEAKEQTQIWIRVFARAAKGAKSLLRATSPGPNVSESKQTVCLTSDPLTDSQ